MTKQADSGLPWSEAFPLMLAPMQGLTNRALRALFSDLVRPDIVFTEFLRAKSSSPKGLSASDLKEVVETEAVPLVVQLVGHGAQALVSAANTAQEAGARHLNLNMGCPFGRMTSGLTGGGMLKEPEALPEILHALRRAVKGSFSVKVRAGFEDPRQIFELLPLFEDVGVDFLVLHPRTVAQKYAGVADHGITAEVAALSDIPVIANGDVTTALEGRKLMDSGAAGLMLGRGAIADPYLFERLRDPKATEPLPEERNLQLKGYMLELSERYRNLFCGDTQVLHKLKEVLNFIEDPHLKKDVRKLKRAQSLRVFEDGLSRLG